MNSPARVLICDDDPIFHLALKQSLKGHFDCRSAYNADEAEAILRNHRVDIILLDVQMRTGDEGLRAIARLKAVEPEASIIMSSGLTDFETVRKAMILGASDYVVKDSDPETLIHSLQRILEKRKLVHRQEQQNFEVVSQQKRHILVGESKGIVALRRMIEKMRGSPANVVIFGETGAGKEVVARQLRGSLEDGSLAPFVSVDSSTIQSSTAESLLFGHEKGAFTGAERQVKGVFEEADGGIVYFDEIANMPLDIQAKLLRVLQEKEFTRLGSTRLIQSSFRVVCASNKDLEEMSKKGLFKDDLLQRLNVLPLSIPPLRERAEDIPLLVEHFKRSEFVFAQSALDALKAYPWPGNVRELINVIAYVTTMAEENEIEEADLPPKIRDSAEKRTAAGAQAEPDTESPTSHEESFYEQVARFERKILTQAYAQNAGNVSRMALRLGMDRSHLYTKLREHKIR
ncbi:MAG: sigma-54 dependent transcriptional regulator [Oligoflexia bacterium]|nr:sigma-54 dependent transcriptional regulator [Oligoflexia bacterium]